VIKRSISVKKSENKNYVTNFGLVGLYSDITNELQQAARDWWAYFSYTCTINRWSLRYGAIHK